MGTGPRGSRRCRGLALTKARAGLGEGRQREAAPAAGGCSASCLLLLGSLKHPTVLQGHKQSWHAGLCPGTLWWHWPYLITSAGAANAPHMQHMWRLEHAVCQQSTALSVSKPGTSGITESSHSKSFGNDQLVHLARWVMMLLTVVVMLSLGEARSPNMGISSSPTGLFKPQRPKTSSQTLPFLLPLSLGQGAVVEARSHQSSSSP